MSRQKNSTSGSHVGDLESSHDSKPFENHVEDLAFNEKSPHASNHGDYSGAVEKTDVREIALVRKLDMRIMPTLWAMYFLNYVSSNA
jgi:hypothetical protein